MYSLLRKDKDFIFVSQHLRNALTQLYQVLRLTKKVLPYSSWLRIIVLGGYLFSLSPIHCLPLGRTSLPLGIMYPFMEFEEIPFMPPIATVGDSGTFSLAGLGRDGGMWGGVTFTSRKI